MNVFKICVRVECEYCEESLLVWVQPDNSDVVVGMERTNYYTDDMSAVQREDVLLLRRDDVIKAARDEGWDWSRRNGYRNTGLSCQKCPEKTD